MTWLNRLCVMIMMLSLAGCGKGRPDFVYEFSERYPLSSRSVQRIDVAAFRPAAGDAARVQKLAQDFRHSGQGKIAIFVPQSGAESLSSGNWVRQELIAQGVSPNRIQWDARPMALGTVRVAFVTTGKGPIWSCTVLYEDIQQRENSTSWLNRETENFGCAYQSNLRAQIENPNDFIRPRPEGPVDAVRAAAAVRQLRSPAQKATPPAAENIAGGS